MPKKKGNASLQILGVMTGTSCDALDCALISVDASGWSTGYAETRTYPENLKKRVTNLQNPSTQVRLKDLLELHRDIGIWLGDALSEIIQTHPEEIDLIACHGQTVAHFPFEVGGGLTLQLGDLSYVVSLTGITTAGNFRVGDLAAGGQGAPLVPVYHQLLIQTILKPHFKKTKGIAIHNLGGMSNLSLLTESGELIAFDTGPGNFWIDQAAAEASENRLQYDRDGRMGSKGTVDKKAIQELLKHPYLKKPFPKSTGRDDFPYQLLKEATNSTGTDLVATATEFSVLSIARAYEMIQRQHPVSHLIFCGGGTRNTHLMKRLTQTLKPIECSTMESWNLSSQWIEAQAFAFLGYLAAMGLPVGGAWTGAEGFGPPAQILPGLNWMHFVQTAQKIAKSSLTT